MCEGFRKNDYTGVKIMKDRVAVVVGTAADRKESQLVVIRKAKKPHCL